MANFFRAPGLSFLISKPGLTAPSGWGLQRGWGSGMKVRCLIYEAGLTVNTVQCYPLSSVSILQAGPEAHPQQ